MIAYLQGKIIDKNPNQIIVLVNGVGYLVSVPLRLSKLLGLHKPTKLFIYTHVREDTLSLYGFLDPHDRQAFIDLLSVSGIGPKHALAILSLNTYSKIYQAIETAQVDFFTAIPGLGKKSAQRIIVDLKAKLKTSQELDFSEAQEFPAVLAALKSLGFSTAEAKNALKGIKNKSHLSPEDIIRQALKNLSQS